MLSHNSVVAELVAGIQASEDDDIVIEIEDQAGHKYSFVGIETRDNDIVLLIQEK